MLRRAVTLVVFLSTATVFGIGPAAARTELIETAPTANAALPTAPTVVTLTFTQDIESSFANLAVTDDDGKNWIDDDPQVQGPQLRATVDGNPRAGGYTVSYRVISTAGDPVTGTYAFTIVGSAAAAAAGDASVTAAPSSAAPSAAAASESTDEDGSSGLWWLVAAACGGLFIGGIYAAIRGIGRNKSA